MPSARTASQLSLAYGSMRASRSTLSRNERWIRTKRVRSSCASISAIVCCLRWRLPPEAKDKIIVLCFDKVDLIDGQHVNAPAFADQNPFERPSRRTSGSGKLMCGRRGSVRLASALPRVPARR